MTAAVVSGNGLGVLAGNPGPSSSPAALAFWLSLLALVFVVVALVGWIRRRREAPLRKEMRAQPVTRQYLVDVKASFFGAMTSQRGSLNLDVHGDSFRVYHHFPPARFLFGQDYSYRGQDTTVEMIPGLAHDWIEISGQSSSSATRLWIGRRKINRQLWDALVSAGAHPVGVPPLLTCNPCKSA